MVLVCKNRRVLFRRGATYKHKGTLAALAEIDRSGTLVFLPRVGEKLRLSGAVSFASENGNIQRLISSRTW